MDTNELCFERAIAFLGGKSCERLCSKVLRLMIDLQESVQQNNVRLALSVSDGIGFAPIIYSLRDQAPLLMIRKAIASEDDPTMPASPDEYLQELDIRFARTWGNATIQLALRDRESLYSWMGTGELASVAVLGDVEVEVALQCPQACYSKLLNDTLSLHNLLYQETLQEACRLASGEALPKREFF